MDFIEQKFREEVADMAADLERAILQLESEPADHEVVAEVFRIMHTLKGSSSMFGFARIGAFTHELEQLFDAVRQGELPITQPLLTLTLQSVDFIRLLLQGNDQAPAEQEQALMATAQDLLAGRQAQVRTTNRLTTWGIDIQPSPLPAEAWPSLFAELQSLGAVIVHQEAPRWSATITGPITLEDVRQVFLFLDPAYAVQVQAFAPARTEQAAEVAVATPATVISSVRVPAERLDQMQALVSELVSLQARLSLYAHTDTAAEISAISEHVEKISRRLRDNAFAMSLVPLETLTTRFQRLVRDVTSALHKQVEFRIVGGDTELDKGIIEAVSDPLLHILRNALDHGIEMPEARLAAGKPAVAQIELRAIQVGTLVRIQIQDDGQGIDPQRIRQRAINRGLFAESVVLPDHELLDLIFHPGFSTAEVVTEISGRGVGLDVVRRRVKELRGQVFLSSTPGQGATFTLELPLSLSVIDGLLVRVGATHYILPMAAVAKCYACSQEDLARSFSQWLVLDQQQVPYIALRDAFREPGPVQALQQVLVVQHAGQRVGLVVDSIVGEYQAVLKPLGRVVQAQGYLSGATILGDGTVALALDPYQLIAQLLPQPQPV